MSAGGTAWLPGEERTIGRAAAHPGRAETLRLWRWESPANPTRHPASSPRGCREDGMEVQLASGLLPLLLLVWLPAGESLHALGSARNSLVFALTSSKFGMWLLLLFPLILQHLTPTPAPAPRYVPCRGVPPPAIACAQAAGSAHGDSVSGSGVLNQYRLQQQGEKTVRGWGRKQMLTSLMTAQGVSFMWRMWIFLNTNPALHGCCCFFGVFFWQDSLTGLQPRPMCW